MIDLIIIVSVLFIIYKFGMALLKGIGAILGGIFNIIMKLLK